MASSTDCDSDLELMNDISQEIGCGIEKRRRWKYVFSRSQTIELSCTSPPRDKGNVVYVCMIMAGAGFLFPWSSYVTAIDYFFFLYWEDFHQVSVAIPMTYLVSTWLFTGLNISIVNYVSLHTRIGLGYILFLTSLIAIPILDVLVHSCVFSIHIAFALTIASVAIVGIGSGVQQSSYYGLAGMLPRRYPQAVMVGESVATTAVSITRIITKSSTTNERFGAIAFFIVSIVFILVCVGCQQIIRNSSFVKHHVSQCNSHSNANKEEENEELRLEEHNVVNDDEDTHHLLSEQVSVINKIKDGLYLRWNVLREIWQLQLSVFVSYFITLLVFPGLVSLIQYCEITDWTPIILVTIFNIPDLIAKWVALVPIPWSVNGLMIGSFSRALLLLPIILLVTPSPSQPIISVGGTLVWAIIFVALLGLTNGYFGSLPMILFSKKIKNPHHLELAGTIMTLSLLSGLMIGSILAYVLTPLTSLATYDKCSSNTTTLFHSCSFNHTNF